VVTSHSFLSQAGALTNQARFGSTTLMTSHNTTSKCITSDDVPHQCARNQHHGPSEGFKRGLQKSARWPTQCHSHDHDHVLQINSTDPCAGELVLLCNTACSVAQKIRTACMSPAVVFGIRHKNFISKFTAVHTNLNRSSSTSLNTPHPRCVPYNVRNRHHRDIEIVTEAAEERG
jgi:hypothetical protein